MTTAFEERGVRTFTMLQARGDVTTSVTPIVLLPFAPHQRVTTTLSAPLLWKRLGAPGAGPEAFTNGGIGDLAASVKWAFLVRNRFAGTSRMAVILSGSVPTGSTDSRLQNGQVAPRSLQLGAGSPSVGASLVGLLIRDRWGLTSSAGYAQRARDGAFEPGWTGRYDVAVGFRFPAYIETIDTRTLQIYLEWNGSRAARARQGGASVADTGGHVAYLSPGLQWVVLPYLMLEGSIQIPVVQQLNGTQSRFGARPGVGLRYLFF